MPDFPKLTLITGGVSSGKSRFAELMIGRFDMEKTYIATARAYDDEMVQKIKEHQKDRQGQGWQTMEAPVELVDAIQRAPKDRIVLVDCLTMWLTNLMMQDVEPDWDAVIQAAKGRSKPTVFVSNEVGLGGISDNQMARRFAKLQGKANHAFAHHVDLAVFVASGLPLVLKGELP